MPGYLVRVASGDDEGIILDVLRHAQRTVIHTDPDRSDGDRVAGLLRHCTSFLVEEADHLAGLCATATVPPTVAQIRVFAVRDRWRERDILRALLPTVRRILRDAGVETLAYLGAESWLLNGLAATGFAHTNTVVTLQKDRFDVPGPGNRLACLRPAREQDIDALLAIDEVAFAPLWRNTRETLRVYLEQMPYVCVAELDGTVAGYECLSLVGRHGHIARIAVHPRFQGQGIGIRLLGEGIAFYRQRHTFAITLNTQLDNERAQRLYAWFGFRLLGQEARVMCLDLHPGAGADPSSGAS